jgi:hypothetical protein
VGEPGIPGGVGVGCGGCVAGLAILAGWVKVRYQLVGGTLRRPFFGLKIPEAVP